MFYYISAMHERFQNLGRFFREKLPWKLKETPQPYETYKALLDEQLAEADTFILDHITLLNEIFYPPELSLFRLAFASVNLQPESSYPFSEDPKSPWQTPDEQLNIMTNRLAASYNLDTEDVFTNVYLEEIINCGKTAARLNSEQLQEELVQYFKQFQNRFTLMKKFLDIP